MSLSAVMAARAASSCSIRSSCSYSGPHTWQLLMDSMLRPHVCMLIASVPHRRCPPRPNKVHPGNDGVPRWLVLPITICARTGAHRTHIIIWQVTASVPCASVADPIIDWLKLRGRPFSGLRLLLLSSLRHVRVPPMNLGRPWRPYQSGRRPDSA